jgi:hypothetical protein
MPDRDMGSTSPVAGRAALNKTLSGPLARVAAPAMLREIADLR